MRTAKYIIVLILGFLYSNVHAQTKFYSIDEFYSYVENKNISLQQADIKMTQAKKAKLAALFGVIDPQGQNYISFINNTHLPVSIIPSEALGGQPGETQELKIGTKYNTTFSITADFKIINIEGWKNLQLSSINISITETDNVLNKKILYENIAGIYWNIIQLQEQLKSTNKNIKVADTLYQVSQNKYDAGIVRQQDINDSKINLISLKENASQIEFLIAKQYIALKILSDIEEDDEFIIAQEITIGSFITKPEIFLNELELKSSILNEKYSLASYNKNRMYKLPTLSFIVNQNANQYNTDLTVFGGDWISSQYIGLKLNMPLPTTTRMSNQFQSKYNYYLAQKNTQEKKIEADLKLKQLDIDWQKANSQVQTNKEIVELQKDSYSKNTNLYNEGLQSIDRTINSFNSLVNAEYNLIASIVSVMLSESKIQINNKFN